VRRSLIVSVGVFGLLLAVTLLVLRRSSPEKEPPFFELARRVPDTLTVAARGDTTVLVPEANGSWRLIRPVVYPADALLVDSMLKRMTPLEVLRTFPLTSNKMDTYGVRLPRGWIRAAYRGGTPPDTLTIGGFTPDGHFGYVRPDSRDVVGLMDERELEPYFLKTTLELRDTRLIPFAESRAVAVRLLGPGGRVRVELEKREDGTWAFDLPYPGPVDGEKMREYLKSISHMHIRDFLPEGEEGRVQAGLDTPRAGIRVLVAPGETRGFDVGNEVPGSDEVYARTLSRPEIVRVSDRYLALLRSDATNLRSMHPIPFGLAVVGEVTIRGGGRERTVPVGPGAADRQAMGVLGRWVTLEAKTVDRATPQALRAGGLSPPAGELVWTSGPDTLARLEVGRGMGDLRSLYVEGGDWARPDEILRVPEIVVAPLWDATLALTDTTGGGGSPP